MERFDAVIVGAGAAGLSAATCAASLGARTLMLDCTDGASSDFAKSGGGPAAAGTSFQQAAGVADSPERWTDDIRRRTNNAVEEAIVRLVTTRARDAIHFQAQQLGMDIHLVKNIPVAGHSVTRLHGTPSESGREYFDMLAAAAGRMPDDHADERRGSHRPAGRGRTACAACAPASAARSRPSRRPSRCSPAAALPPTGTCLRSSRRRSPMPLHIGCPHNDGSGIIWAQALGAATSFLDSYQGHGHVTVDRKGRLGLGLTTLGAILVDRNGRRFVREDIGPSELAAHVLAAPGGTAVEVYDQSVHDVAISMGAYRDVVAAALR